MLPSLYQSLKSEKRRHTLVFIGFAEEEKGLWGSRDYVDRLSAEEREQIDAMINIDSVGVEPPEVWESHANKMLVSWAAALAKLQQQKITAVNFEKVGDADSTSFYDRKIPAITFHAMKQESLGVIHSQRDVLSAINHQNLYATYKFLVGYVALVDAKADKALRTK